MGISQSSFFVHLPLKTTTKHMSNNCSQFQRQRTLKPTLKSSWLPISPANLPRFLLRTQSPIDCKDWTRGWTWPPAIGLKPKAAFSAMLVRLESGQQSLTIMTDEKAQQIFEKIDDSEDSRRCTTELQQLCRR